MAAIGIFGLTRGDTGSSVIGAFFISIGGEGLLATGSTRVWVDGSVLLLRMPYKGTRTLRLDRITRASISPFSQNKGPMLSLQDADGRSLTIDATNLQLKGLYIVLARHVPAGGAGWDDRLERRLRKHRHSELPG